MGQKPAQRARHTSSKLLLRAAPSRSALAFAHRRAAAQQQSQQSAQPHRCSHTGLWAALPERDYCVSLARRLEVISEAFAGLPLVKRHQLVYGLLGDELKAGLHALSMKLKTPTEAGT